MDTVIANTLSKEETEEGIDEKMVEIKTFPIFINTHIIQDIQKLVEDYTLTHRQTIFSKSQRKIEQPEYVWNNIEGQRTLTQSTFFIDREKLYIDYPLFKLYLHKEIYNDLIQYIEKLIMQIIHSYHTFEIHLNIKGFTISAAKRYYTFIQLFFERFFNETTGIGAYMNLMYIYNRPSVLVYFKDIFKYFMNNKFIKDKIVFC